MERYHQKRNYLESFNTVLICFSIVFLSSLSAHIYDGVGALQGKQKYNKDSITMP